MKNKSRGDERVINSVITNSIQFDSIRFNSISIRITMTMMYLYIIIVVVQFFVLRSHSSTTEAISTSNVANYFPLLDAVVPVFDIQKLVLSYAFQCLFTVQVHNLLFLSKLEVPCTHLILQASRWLVCIIGSGSCCVL